MSTKDEIVVIVDADNKVVDQVPRSRMRSRHLTYRATYILVFNSEQQILVQKRTATKDMYPSYYDVAAGGVVTAGESYDESATREAQEELGLVGVSLTPHFDFYFEDPSNRVWGRVYSCIYDGELVLQEEEIEECFFCAPGKVLAGEIQPVTPDSIEALRRYSFREAESR
jgi:8-oxo-dGTP pyrophosphatase MutT (NUDIX family)